MNAENLPAQQETQIRWMKWMLLAAGIYNLCWGLWVIAYPMALFRFTHMPLPLYPWIWQCVGMIVGVYGVSYWLAAADPLRYWPIVLTGLLGKILGPIGFLIAAMAGNVPWRWGVFILTNDIAWWIPFAIILLVAHRQNRHVNPPAVPLQLW